jgi:hypothetical protein
MNPVTKNYPITPATIARIRAAAVAEDINLTQDSGTINKSGVTASYELKGDNLAVTLLSKPFFISSDTFFNKLEDTLQLV